MKSNSTKLLLVEDDHTLNFMLTEELKEQGINVRSVKTIKDAKEALDQDYYTLVLTDLKLPDGEGEELINYVQKFSIAPNFIMITAFGSIKQAVRCLKMGASDFLTKPLDFEHLILSIKKVLGQRELSEKLNFYQTQHQEKGFRGIIGRDSNMLQIYDQIKMIGPSDAPVLIIGESGTGKELVAKAIHQESQYKEGPFIPINCAGIPEDLFESEFFGHLEGSFTGANKARKGLFQQAHKGTLFLDEIGELPQKLQGKLLRVLQDKKIKRVGSDNYTEVDVRIVAATNRDMETEVERGRFRKDLYYRLEAFSLYLPPLRDRKDDIPLLIEYFMHHFSKLKEKNIKTFSPQAETSLLNYEYPGNVRELINLIDRITTFCRGDIADIDTLPQKLKESTPTASIGNKDEFVISATNILSLEELDKKYIEYVLHALEGNKRRAAMALGIGRKTLYRKLSNS